MLFDKAVDLETIDQGMFYVFWQLSKPLLL
jgi:hypothetical protein